MQMAFLHTDQEVEIFGARDSSFYSVCFEINNFDSSGLTSRKGVHIVNFFSIICQSFWFATITICHSFWFVTITIARPPITTHSKVGTSLLVARHTVTPICIKMRLSINVHRSKHNGQYDQVSLLFPLQFYWSKNNMIWLLSFER